MPVDVYGRNPLAEWARTQHPERYAAVAAVKPPPKMFANGLSDLPAFTASGLDPQLLLKLPYTMRHAVAADPDLSRVHRWFEAAAGKPAASMPHVGFDDYSYRVEEWLNRTKTAAEQAEEDRFNPGLIGPGFVRGAARGVGRQSYDDPTTRAASRRDHGAGRAPYPR